MPGGSSGPLLRALAALTIVSGCLALGLSPERAAWPVLLGLILSVVPLRCAWNAAGGTALRPAVVWASLAVALAAVAQWVALGESLATGRPVAGHCVYLETLATFAALVTVLNARSPGGGAWAILMALLMLVFLIPWLEGPGLARVGGLSRLRLENPWTIFYGLVVTAGVTNFLPTRYGPAAALVGLGFVLEYLALTGHVASTSGRGVVWSAVPITLSAALWVALVRSGSAPRAPTRLEAVWFWFRDHWGVVWALRVMERFNRTAESQRWGFRLTWHGIVPDREGVPPKPSAVDAGSETLAVLLRRFADAQAVEGAGEAAGSRPCREGGVG